MKLKQILHIVNFNYLKANHLALLILFDSEPATLFTYETLQHRLHIPKRTLERNLLQLAQLNLIKVFPGSRGGNTPNPTRFQLLVQENNSHQPA